MTQIRIADGRDHPLLGKYDSHIPPERLDECIRNNRIIVCENGGEFVGWLRYGFFWDSVPFMNMLFVLEAFRGKGYGGMLTEKWETVMKQSGFDCVMTSTQANEYSQHFYRKHGYEDTGGFFPTDEPYELILTKRLG